MSDSRLLLAGDIGGTKTILVAFQIEGKVIRALSERNYPSRNYTSFEAILRDFRSSLSEAPEAACFGVAGPILAGRCQTTNLPWQLDERELAAVAATDRLRLLNDLEAAAIGTQHLTSGDFITLHAGIPSTTPGNLAVIAAGTGLGEAVMARRQKESIIVASEGGHADFAPSSDVQIELLRHLRERFGHVSYERVLSGPGLANIYRFILARVGKTEPDWFTDPQQEAARQIVDRATREGDQNCHDAIDLFVRIYGAEAGNLALKGMTIGGLYVAGGMAPTLFPAWSATFLESFFAKGRLEALMRTIPVHVVINPKLPLIGACYAARNLLADSG